jgi:hypothetical protein
MENGQTKLLVVKSSSTLRKFAKEPHDIMKELRLLASVEHPNVCAHYLDLHTLRIVIRCLR